MDTRKDITEQKSSLPAQIPTSTTSNVLTEKLAELDYLKDIQPEHAYEVLGVFKTKLDGLRKTIDENPEMVVALRFGAANAIVNNLMANKQLLPEVKWNILTVALKHVVFGHQNTASHVANSLASLFSRENVILTNTQHILYGGRKLVELSMASPDEKNRQKSALEVISAIFKT